MSRRTPYSSPPEERSALSPPPIRALSRPWQWALIVPFALTLVALFRIAGVPSALLLGPVIASGALGLRGATARVNRRLYEGAQGVAGCLIAHYLTPEILRAMLADWPVVLVFSLVTLVIACFVGWAVGRLTDIDHEVAIWGFLPGMAGAVIAMSEERGLDSRMVALMQMLRLVSVIFAMSALAWAISGGMAPPPAPGAATAGGAGVALTLLIAGMGPLAARFLPMIPAGSTLVPLILASLFGASGLVVLALPDWLLLAAYFVLGCQVGLRFTPEMMRHGLRATPAILVAALGLMALCGVSGLALSLLRGIDLMSAMLATVPGSIDAIGLLAVKGHADVGFVMTMQVVRLFTVVLAGPVLAHWLTRRVAERPGE
jgi:membrane AbrB-like protein